MDICVFVKILDEVKKHRNVLQVNPKSKKCFDSYQS